MVNFVTRSMDRADLVLPDGRHADSLRLVPLRRELERLGIPGMTPEMGKEGLLTAYARHVASIAEQIYERAAQPGELRVKDISQTAARHAALLLERRAAQGSAIDASPSNAPARPIATTSTRA
jgi:hypothetical protein